MQLFFMLTTVVLLVVVVFQQQVLRTSKKAVSQLKCDLEVANYSLSTAKENDEEQKKELAQKQSEIARLTTRLSFAQNLIPDINQRIDVAIQEEESKYEQALQAQEERIKKDTIKRWHGECVPPLP